MNDSTSSHSWEAWKSPWRAINSGWEDSTSSHCWEAWKSPWRAINSGWEDSTSSHCWEAWKSPWRAINSGWEAMRRCRIVHPLICLPTSTGVKTVESFIRWFVCPPAPVLEQCHFTFLTFKTTRPSFQ
ncbi:unnamed protein product [Phytophthora lilii]|uniref:Unnamed protein product n=1 Tax=Phytophthora lilii TaxID=2077276 RepID=A0A9W6UD71_9STRA|nr:unnamed protein product [Phytophthora lilii]